MKISLKTTKSSPTHQYKYFFQFINRMLQERKKSTKNEELKQHSPMFPKLKPVCTSTINLIETPDKVAPIQASGTCKNYVSKFIGLHCNLISRSS